MRPQLLDVTGAWSSLVESPVFALALTLAVYEASRRGWERLGRPPLLNPVLVSIVVIGAACRSRSVSPARSRTRGSMTTGSATGRGSPGAT